MTGAGLREQKKARTREAIQRAALGLIEKHGYEATTCEQIAAAAEVSPATFFRYFPSKEDVVLNDDYDPMIADVVVARPSDEPPLTAIRRALAEALATVADDLPTVRQRARLIVAVPALRARSTEQTASLTRYLSRAVAERLGVGEDDLRPQVIAAAAAAALTVGVRRWTAEEGELAASIDAALASLGTLDDA